MFKKNTNKILATALCTAVMAAFYGAPVMAAEQIIGEKDAFQINVADSEGKAGDSYFKVWNSDGSIMLDIVNTASQKVFSVDTLKGTASVGPYVELSQYGISLYKEEEHNILSNTISLSALDGRIKASAFNGVTLESSSGNIVVGGIDITDIKGEVDRITPIVDSLGQPGSGEGTNTGGIKRDLQTSTTTIEGGVGFNKNGGMTGVTSINDVAFDVSDVGKITLGNNAYDLAGFKTSIEDLTTRVDNLEKTGITGGDNVTVTPPDTTGGAGGTGNNDYVVSLDKEIEVDKITAGEGTIGNVTMAEGNITATGNVSGKTGNIGGVTMEDGKVTATRDVVAGGVSLKGVNDRVGAVGKDVDTIKTDVAELETDVGTIKTDVGTIKTDVDTIKTGFENLGTSVNKLEQSVAGLDSRINRVDDKVNKVGAGAAALAALHPLDFDPDDKLTFAAGVGHYEGETAAALGAFYRPDEKVMFSLGGTVGNGDEMINAGISFALDRTSNVNNSKVAMAKEIVDLKEQVAQLTAVVNQMAALNGMANKQVEMFPDVPENHWAYAYLEKLAQAGIIEGYPDGNFSGDRSMTRYEFATMLCRALEKGIVLDQRVAGEFAAELNRISVDRISGEDNEADKVERVRVVKAAERDNYGSKIK